MFNTPIYLNIWTYSIGTIGIISFIYMKEIYKKSETVQYAHKSTQTDEIERVNNTCLVDIIKMRNIGIQCDLDMLILEDDETMNLAVVSAPSSNYRWFFLNMFKS